jgi:hypothetical protein
VVVAGSEVGAVRKVVKQLPVEMLQQYSSASRCMRTRSVMEELYIGVSIPRLLFWMDLRSFYLVFRNTLVAWIPLSTLLSCPRK